MSVSIADVVKTFGTYRAIDGISVEIPEGAFFVVLGPSGCGKSTLLRLIAGLEQLDGGTIHLGGDLVSGPDRHVPPEARRTGVVFQSYALWPHMSVRDNVAFPAEAQGETRARARVHADRHLATVELTEYGARKPADLSGGQRQRVALARCLAGGARWILMDEPLANLDPHLRGTMEHEIAAFHRASGATTIYITHDQREAMALASQIAVMWEGRLLQIADPVTLHDRPASAEVARFIGRAAVLPAMLDAHDGGLIARFGPVSARARRDGPQSDGPAEIVIRPKDVTIGTGLDACVTRSSYRGGIWEADVAVEGLDAPLPVASDLPLRSGDHVRVDVGQVWALPPK